MQTPLNWREIAFNSVPVAAVKKVSNVNEVREGCDHYLKYSPNYVYCDAFMCIAFIYIYIYIYLHKFFRCKIETERCWLVRL